MRAALFLAASLFLAACARPDPPKLTPLSARVTSIGTAGLDVEVTLEAFNPNAVDLSARSATAKVTLDGKYDVGTVTVPHAVDLPSHKKTKLTVPVSAKWKDLAGLTTLAGQSRAIPYQVDGTVELGGDLLHVDVPFHVTGTITHEQIVQAAISALPKIPGLPLIPGAR